MPPVIVNPQDVHAFATEADFQRWLAKNHATQTEIWIRVQKKGSGVRGILITEALDVALCWGWIDAIRKSLDETTYLQRYTPRQKRSPWSLINTAHVARLIEAGRMQPPGYAQIAAAKADGRWDIAYSGARDMKTPPELMAAIDANAKARAMYDTLTSQNRYALAFRLINLKTEAARARRVAEFVEMLARGETFYPNRKTSVLRAEAKAEGQTASVESASKSDGVTTQDVAKSVAKKSATSIAKKVAKSTRAKRAEIVTKKIAKKATNRVAKTVTKKAAKKR
ncbi:MAG: YdeI/OmpD-associated family protein [Phycisphaerae bacterium]|nr:YdeI/OmpD-associated family protein [Gemmatimonadaceae bacterium]